MATYDRIADRYDVAIRPLESWILARLRQKALASLPSKGLILELGAGTGLNFQLYKPTLRTIATEPSREMLRVAQPRTAELGIELVQSCAEQLPFSNSTFDAAIATLVFCSVKSQSQSFAEIRRVVKPGGLVILLEHVRPDNILGPLTDIISRITVPLFNDHFNRRTAEQARDSGLEVVGVEKHCLGILNLITCRV